MFKKIFWLCLGFKIHQDPCARSPIHTISLCLTFYIVFSDEDSHNSDEEDYCYAYIDVSSRKCEEYYIGGDVLIQLRKQLTQNKYTSLKGSRSMDSILSHNTIS